MYGVEDAIGDIIYAGSGDRTGCPSVDSNELDRAAKREVIAVVEK